jgi:hypothetical protein
MEQKSQSRRCQDSAEARKPLSRTDEKELQRGVPELAVQDDHRPLHLGQDLDAQAAFPLSDQGSRHLRARAEFRDEAACRQRSWQLV